MDWLAGLIGVLDRWIAPYSAWQVEIALICAVSILMLVRSRQVWACSCHLGYSNARAARLKEWLQGWAAAGFIVDLACITVAWFPLGLLISISNQILRMEEEAASWVRAASTWRFNWGVVEIWLNQRIYPYSLPQVEIGILCGLGVLLLVRASQVWALRKRLAYSDYGVARLQRWLRQRAALGFCLALLGTGVYWFIVFYREPGPFGIISAEQVAQLPPGQPVTRVIIPVLGVESVVLEAPIIGWEWDVTTLNDEVGHLEGTPEPGQQGNAVIAGHVTSDPGGVPGPFWELSQVQMGDYIYVEQGSETIKFEVVEIKRVGPEDVASIYQDSPYSQLYLLTCDSYKDGVYTRRLIVIARRIT